jgi:tetratricopeptide (TPR) repeat protein
MNNRIKAVRFACKHWWQTAIVVLVLLVAAGYTLSQVQKVSTGVQPSPMATKQPMLALQVAEKDQAFDDPDLALSADPEAQQYFEMGMEAYQTAEQQLKGSGLTALRAANSAKIAYQDFSQAIERDQQWAAAYFYRAVVASILEHSQDDQLRDLDQAIKVKPDFARAWYERAILLIEMNRGEEGFTSLERAVEAKPDYYQALITRGSVYKVQQNWEKALEDFNRAEAAMPSAVDPLNAWALYAGRCFVFFELKHNDAALPDCNRAVELLPNEAEAYITRSSIYTVTGNIKGMIADYTKAMELDSDFREKLQANSSGLKNVVLATLKPDSEEYKLLTNFINTLDTSTEANN